MHKRKWLLPCTITLIILPLFAVLIFSGLGIYRQQRGMIAEAENFSRKHSEDLARDAHRLPIEFWRASEEEKLELLKKPSLPRSLGVLVSGIPLYGWIALFDEEGKLVIGKGGARQLPEDALKVIRGYIKRAITERRTVNGSIKIGKMPTSAISVTGIMIKPQQGSIRSEEDEGSSKKYLNPYKNKQRYAAICVISHTMFPPNLVNTLNITSYLYSMLIGIAVASLGVVMLIKFCIQPLHDISNGIRDLKIGKETFNVMTGTTIPEITEIETNLKSLTEYAADREKQKREYKNSLLRTLDEELNNLAKRIHDYPVQSVMSNRIRISRVMSALSKEDRQHYEAIHNTLSDAIKLCDETETELRDICAKIAPLRETAFFGIREAMKNITDKVSGILRNRGLEISVHITDIADYPMEEAQIRVVCHIVSSAVQNAVLNMNSEHIEIALKDTGNGLYSLMIRCDGDSLPEGFIFEDDPELLHSEGFDEISEMMEFANSVSGTFIIKNGAPSGTSIAVHLPHKLKRLNAPLSRWNFGEITDMYDLAEELTRVLDAKVTAEVDIHDMFIRPRIAGKLCDIARQAVSNAVLRGAATVVNISLVYEGGNYVLHVRDNGIGLSSDVLIRNKDGTSTVNFDYLRDGHHRGIIGMNKNAHIIGGTFSLENAESGGTLVTVMLPAKK